MFSFKIRMASLEISDEKKTTFVDWHQDGGQGEKFAKS
jgi:hypothetical protein